MKKKCAITVGVFDCLHEGHVNLLKRMRELGEEIIVLVHDDLSTFQNKGRFPVQTLAHRKHNLTQSGLTDHIFSVTAPDPSVALHSVVTSSEILGKDAVYVRGDDWKDFPGNLAVRDRGIEIVFVPYTKGVSTTQIRNELKNLCNSR